MGIPLGMAGKFIGKGMGGMTPEGALLALPEMGRSLSCRRSSSRCRSSFRPPPDPWGPLRDD